MLSRNIIIIIISIIPIKPFCQNTSLVSFIQNADSVAKSYLKQFFDDSLMNNYILFNQNQYSGNFLDVLDVNKCKTKIG